MQLTSPVFKQGETIPTKYTCDGHDFSPPLAWESEPQGTQSYALIADDPDAPTGTWVHWVIFNIPAEVHDLSEHIPAEATLADGTKQGLNDFRKIGYGGPCPPNGTHRYYFKLYALDTMLDLKADVTKTALLEAMQNHILGEAQLMGNYNRI